jgi:hypothetical protein
MRGVSQKSCRSQKYNKLHKGGRGIQEQGRQGQFPEEEAKKRRFLRNEMKGRRQGDEETRMDGRP